MFQDCAKARRIKSSVPRAKSPSDRTSGASARSAVARALAKVSIAATIANSRGPETLADLVKELGPTIKAGTLAEAARADIVLVALRWSDAERVLTALSDWNGRIVIDGTNPVAFLPEDSPERNDPSNPLAAYGTKALDLGGTPSTQIIAGCVPGARVVSMNLQPEHKAVLEGPDEHILTGADTLPMRVNDITLHLRPQSFFQTNTDVAGALYRQAAEWVAAAAPASVWDLYCGVGGFALHAARAGVAEVTGVEVSISDCGMREPVTTTRSICWFCEVLGVAWLVSWSCV